MTSGIGVVVFDTLKPVDLWAREEVLKGEIVAFLVLCEKQLSAFWKKSFTTASHSKVKAEETD